MASLLDCSFLSFSDRWSDLEGEPVVWKIFFSHRVMVFEVSMLMAQDSVRCSTEKVVMIRDCILAAQSRLQTYADRRRRPFVFGDL